MKIKKLILYSLLFLSIISVSWYLFLKGYNYKVSFKTSHPPGVVYATLTDWETLNRLNLDSINYIERSPFSSITYTLFKKDSIFNYDWRIEPQNDSLTKITAFITDKDNSLLQNLLVPFKKNDFVLGNINEVKGVMTYLKTLESSYDLNILKDSTFKVPAKYCAYIPVKSTIGGKAKSMMNNISYVMDYIRSNNLTLDGDPFLSITKMDIKNGVVEYDFCFPIEKNVDLPISDKVKIKTTDEFTAIKAIFNGNYRSTEYAWYELIRYANANNIEFTYLPTEIYKNDPQSGTDALSWVAEIYLPLK